MHLVRGIADVHGTSLLKLRLQLGRSLRLLEFQDSFLLTGFAFFAVKHGFDGAGLGLLGGEGLFLG